MKIRVQAYWRLPGWKSDWIRKTATSIRFGLSRIAFGYSEIYVTQLQDLRENPIPTVVTWPEESSTLDHEQEMLRSVSQFLADRNDIYQASSASLLAGTIQAESKANIIAGSGRDPVLELKLDYNRAWVQVRQALQSAEIDILDENRDQSVINVRFAGAADEVDPPGWFGRLLGRGKSSRMKLRISVSGFLRRCRSQCHH